MFNFLSLSMNSLRFSDFEFDFAHFTPQVRLFFVGKRKPKILGFKHVMERGIKQIYLS